jgi:hypothetical protein
MTRMGTDESGIEVFEACKKDVKSGAGDAAGKVVAGDEVVARREQEVDEKGGPKGVRSVSRRRPGRSMDAECGVLC